MNDIVTLVFSKDRPLQLDLALNTYNNFSRDDISNIYVLYNCSSKKYEEAYEKLKLEHSDTCFFRESNFKKDLLYLLNGYKNVLFMVDDCIFTNYFSLKEIQNILLDIPSSIGFSLRLGRNTKECYPIKTKNQIPNVYMRPDSIIYFDWTSVNHGDFSYPLEVSSSIYRIKDLEPLLLSSYYHSPNSLESLFYMNLNQYRNFPILFAYEISCAFCNPLNKIQHENFNRHGNKEEYSTHNLLSKYMHGYRANWRKFHGFISNGCHQEVNLQLIYAEN